jgi:hypothetical protein
LLSLLAPPPPRWRHRLRASPLRTAGFVVGDASMRFALASRLLRRRDAGEREPGVYRLADWAGSS